MAQLEAMIKSSSNKRDLELNEVITEGSHKKGRLTLVGERADFLEGLAVQGIHTIEQLKGVDEGHHREILNLMNVAGSAYDERQQLYEGAKAEFENLHNRISALETTVGKMGSLVQSLGTSDSKDVFST